MQLLTYYQHNKMQRGEGDEEETKTGANRKSTHHPCM